MTDPTSGVPPPGKTVVIASDSAWACTALMGATSTLGAESTPQKSSLLKSERPMAALSPERPANTPFNAWVVISHFEGCAGSARTVSDSQDSVVWSGGGLHPIVPVRSSTNRMLDGTSSEA